MTPRTLEIVVAGKRHRVTTSASEVELARLAGIVEERVLALTPPGKAPAAEAVLLAAIALAHDLEAERKARAAIEEQAKVRLERILAQVDLALDACDDDDAEDGSGGDVHGSAEDDVTTLGRFEA